MSPTKPSRRVGRLDGRAIDLDQAAQSLPHGDLERVEEDLPDGSVVRPWRFAGDGRQGCVRADGVVVLG